MAYSLSLWTRFNVLNNLYIGLMCVFDTFTILLINVYTKPVTCDLFFLAKKKNDERQVSTRPHTFQTWKQVALKHTLPKKSVDGCPRCYPTF